MASKFPCKSCNTPCYGVYCLACSTREALHSDPKHCSQLGCSHLLDTRRNKSGYCRKHFNSYKVLVETSHLAPPVPPVPAVHGEALIVSDLHIPYHDPVAVQDAIEAAKLLGLHRLIIAGDLLHMDVISRYVKIGPTVSIEEEIDACRKVLRALEEVFSEILIIPGNHDQRIEKFLGAMVSKEGLQSLQLLSAAMGSSSTNMSPADLVERFLNLLLGSSTITFYPLPDLLLNDTWLIQHPSNASRVAPQNQRKMAEKHHKCVLEGHSHLFAIGFDASGKFICMNTGHLCDDTKFRYMREQPTSFPTTVKGFCAILIDDDHPQGYLLPVALHTKWFTLEALKKRFNNEEKSS